MSRPVLLLAALTLLFAGAGSAHGPGGPEQMLRNGDRVLLVPPGDLVAQGAAPLPGVWSPDGRAALCRTGRFRIDGLDAPPLTEGLLTLWSQTSRQPTTLLRIPGAYTGRLDVAWIRGAEAALVLTDLPPPPPAAGRPPAPEPRHGLVRVDARRRSLRVVGEVPQTARLLGADALPLAVLHRPDERRVQVLRADGTAAREITLPAGHRLSSVHWEPGGRTLRVSAAPPADAKAPPLVFFRADPVTGRIEVSPGVTPPPEPSPGKPVLRVRSGGAVLTEGQSRREITPLWLEWTPQAKPEPLLLAAHGEWGVVSPTEEAVLYADNGGVWVSTFVPVPLARYLQARAAAERARVTNSAKQVGLAIHMYAADHDDQLPPAGTPLQETLSPYLMNAAPFAGFVYTGQGGKLTDYPDPSNQELGYVAGPGGKAVLYADGHVVWKPGD